MPTSKFAREQLAGLWQWHWDESEDFSLIGAMPNMYGGYNVRARIGGRFVDSVIAPRPVSGYGRHLESIEAAHTFALDI
jgi:hypothetical protein